MSSCQSRAERPSGRFGWAMSDGAEDVDEVLKPGGGHLVDDGSSYGEILLAP